MSKVEKIRSHFLRIFCGLFSTAFLSVAGGKCDRYKFMYAVQHFVSAPLRTSNDIAGASNFVFSFHRVRFSHPCFYSHVLGPSLNTQVRYSIVLYQSTSVKIWNGSKEGLSESSILTCHIVQARNQGGCTGCVRTPPQAPKVHILILNIQVKECNR